MIVQPATPGARGLDTIAVFHETLATDVKQAGLGFVVRYLRHDQCLTATEVNIILAANLALLAVTGSRAPGWVPSASMGMTDGLQTVELAKLAALPAGLSIYLDFEGPSGSTQDCVDYINAWAHEVQRAGYRAGLYVGYGVPLTPDQLYHSLAVTGYWHSCSTVPAVAVRGYQMRQLTPPNQHAFGTMVDYDTILLDNKGDVPHWLIGAP
jgi:hypothetical protein